MYVLEKNKGGQVKRGKQVSQSDQSQLLWEVTNLHTMSRKGGVFFLPSPFWLFIY